jgi:hypothetical protein
MDPMQLGLIALAGVFLVLYLKRRSDRLKKEE